MENLNNKQLLIGKVAATLADTDPMHCALMRATGDMSRFGCIASAGPALGITDRQAVSVACGWDNAQYDGASEFAAERMDREYYNLGRQAWTLVFGEPKS